MEYSQNGYDPFWDFELIDRYPPNSFGQVLADTIERQVGGKELGISVTYRNGYLIVVEQPKPVLRRRGSRPMPADFSVQWPRPRASKAVPPPSWRPCPSQA